MMFEPFGLGSLALANRIVMAPMTRSRVDAEDAPGTLNAEYYAQRASCGLIVSEATVVSPSARGYLFTPGLYSAAQTAGWRLVTDAVHRAGGRIFAQLWHVGRVGHSSLHPEGAAPVGPTDEWADDLYTFARDASGVPGKVAVSRPRALLAEDMPAIVGAFVAAGVNARRAGFDGIEILAANGYLFDQFLSAGVNARHDSYGGDRPESRARLLLETLDASRDALQGFPIGVRLSPYGSFNSMPDDATTEETFLFLADELRHRRAAYVHFNDEPISIGHLNEAILDNRPNEERAAAPVRRIPASFLRDFRDRFRRPVILCGALDGARARAMLRNGLADLAAFGVPFIANPDLPDRLRHGWPLAEPKTELFYGGGAAGYTDYPRHQHIV